MFCCGRSGRTSPDDQADSAGGAILPALVAVWMLDRRSLYGQLERRASADAAHTKSVHQWREHRGAAWAGWISRERAVDL